MGNREARRRGRPGWSRLLEPRAPTPEPRPGSPAPLLHAGGRAATPPNSPPRGRGAGRDHDPAAGRGRARGPQRRAAGALRRPEPPGPLRVARRRRKRSAPRSRKWLRRRFRGSLRCGEVPNGSQPQPLPAEGSPRRHRSTSPSPSRLKERRDEEKKETKETKSKERQITEEDLEGKTEEEIEMMKLMGFASFDSTKGKKVDGSVNAYAINVSQKRKYRQYMNRKGGFNRPLDFIA
uniref:U4/U6.U5 small nuclear ribonucleoprotein 27 kDa protein n=1 Tax=Canis lupus familiaris TaxID=9615 RepID=A0A8I3PT62_CANLF